MKIKIIFFIIFSLFVHANNNEFQSSFPTVSNYLDHFEFLENHSNLILVKTLPFSGTNITIAILNQLTGKNCLWDRGNRWEKAVLVNRAMVDTNDFEFPILGSHFKQVFAGLENNILISTKRDYREWFGKICRRKNITTENIKTYMQHLQFFDEWPEDKKFLIKYEDILDNPYKVINDLAKFLHSSDARVKELLSSYKKFSKKVFLSYKNHVGTSNIELKKSFHRKRFSENEIKLLEDRLKETNRYLFDKYLKCYDTTL